MISLMSLCDKKHLLAFSGLLFLLNGCAPSAGPVDAASVLDQVTDDRVQTQTAQLPEKPGEKLKLEDALARAIKYNLDTKVAEMDELIAADDVSLQMLNTLPSVTGKIQRQGRNNAGGSSSFSLLTGMESLQPSISQEQYRNVNQLSAEWNLLDAGINLWRAKSSTDQVMIAQERRRKVYHSVVQDTYTAYWRAAVAQTAIPEINTLLGNIDKQINNIDEQVKQGLVPLGTAQTARTQLLERRMQLTRMRHGMALADVELKTLISYPLDQALTLDLENQNPMRAKTLPSIKGKMEEFEKTAFVNRPEVREEILNKRISTRDIKMSLLETIPGIDLLFSYNYDSNKYLVENTWIDGIVGLTATINKIITAPARYSRAKNVDLLADKRRQALVAAVVTQIYVSKARYDSLSYEYAEQDKNSKNADAVLKRAKNYNDAGLMSKAELLNVSIDSSIADINTALAYSDAQDAYGRFITTLGVDLWDADDAGLGVPDFAHQIRKNLDSSDIFLTSGLEQKKVVP